MNGTTTTTSETPAFLATLRTQLTEAPDQIAAAEQKVADAHKVLEEKTEIRKAISVKLSLAIANETDANNKAVYSNAEKRDAELINRQGTDKDYLAADREVKSAADALSSVKIEFNRTINRFSSARHLSDLYSGYYRSRG